eukprot:6185935-Pleurochrysis_carterae.AAC.4
MRRSDGVCVGLYPGYSDGSGRFVPRGRRQVSRQPRVARGGGDGVGGAAVRIAWPLELRRAVVAAHVLGALEEHLATPVCMAAWCGVTRSSMACRGGVPWGAMKGGERLRWRHDLQG